MAFSGSAMASEERFFDFHEGRAFGGMEVTAADDGGIAFGGLARVWAHDGL
jgi:hypothetical protein